jgi:DNA topoisomerase-1
MRTDSTRISGDAIGAARDFIGGRFGAPYVPEQPNVYRSKKDAQDAHEAIRPTDVTLTPDQVKRYLSAEQHKLYELIWRRFVASFMTPAIFDTVRADIGAAKLLFRATGSTLKFAGFYAVWPREDDSDTLPPLATSEELTLRKLSPEQHFTQPPPRFTEASLIKELEERGIGRPSTYVPIVSTIQDRGYVEQQDRKFTPTWLGETVNELMIKHFPNIVDVNFTAEMERKLDDVEEGKQVWTAFLDDFYTAFSERLERATSEMEKVQKPVEELDELCPVCGKHLVIRSGRFGKFISCSGYPECSYKRAIVNKTGVLCPVDGGDLVERRGKKTGKVFYGCANFPTCNFVVWDRPLTIPCPECGGLLTLPNGKEEAACVKCGALVKGALEGAPVVVGHRAITERPARAARASSNGRAASAKTSAKAKAPTKLKAKATTKRATAKKSTTTRKTTSRTTTRSTTRTPAAV